MRIVGISEGMHDAALSVIDDTEIIYASHSERYSRVKNDKWVHKSQWKLTKDADTVAYYEKPFWKNTRRLYSGRSWKKTNTEYDISFRHHESHAAAGYYTAPFDDCNVLVIDAIGEWDTVSIWEGKNNELKKIKSWKYPYSLGLLYSAITQYIGLKPNEDEYITMGMAAYGEPKVNLDYLLWENNHYGISRIELPVGLARNEDLAASVQTLYENKLLELVKKCPKKNLILMGGCALNCVANSKIKDKNIWIMPSPGDAGNALGAAALVEKKKLNWKHPYLGHNISREVNAREVVDHLLKY